MIADQWTDNICLMSSLSVTQLQRAREFISTLGAYNYNALADLLSDDFTHRFFPLTLNGMGKPVRNAQEFLDHLKKVKLAIEEFNVSVKKAELLLRRYSNLIFQLEEKDVIQGQDVVVLHVSKLFFLFFSVSILVNGLFQLLADGKTVSGRPYKNEYMFTFRFRGEKIASIKEFMDSKYVTEALEAEAKAKKE